MVKDELTVEQVKKMSQSELFTWADVFAKERQAEEIQRILINYLELETAKKVVV